MTYRPPSIGPKKLVLTGPASSDINAILDYLAREAGVETALRFADKIDAELAKLAFVGHAGVSREWLSPGLRLTIIGSYVVYFRVTESETRIVRVLHGARDIASLDFDADPT